MNKWKKLHGTAIFFIFAARVKDFLIPLLFSFFAGNTGVGSTILSLLFPVLLTFLLIHSVLYWYFFTYQLESGELRIKHGIFVKKKRYINKDRVQSVDSSSHIVHRWFGVEKVKIETAGGGLEPEVELKAVLQTEAQRIKELLRKENDSFTNVYETEEEKVKPPMKIYDVPFSAIFLKGLTSSKVGLVFSASAALLTQIEQFLPRTFYEESIGVIISMGTMFIVLLLLVMALIAWGISVVITVVQYGRFVIRYHEDELILVRGLLERRQLTLPLHRITSVRYDSNPLQQLLGYWSIYVYSAGGGSQEEQLSTLLVPLGRKKDIHELMEDLLPYAKMPAQVKPLPKKAVPRYVMRTSLISWLLWLLSLYFVPYTYGVLLFFVPVCLSVWGWKRYADSGFLLENGVCIIQNRSVSISCSIIPKRKIQSVHWEQSFLQKRWRLHTMRADILSTSGGRSFQLKDVEEQTDNDIVRWYKKGLPPKEERLGRSSL
ncbi:putative membrane protein [Alteribacillus persepolensis]|uniref:Putative membrane protein n=1 Tax=Alteribacillus persepolensis TaxID=568899 RepID=A0A1G7ZCF5_9BACI|nr:PH domain-containing protein [Alteribacillus persepolensis]SDH05760.1 putative membrane protein [Alteribacillus persepolensis]